MKMILMFPLRVIFLPAMIVLKVVSLLTKGIAVKASGILTLFSVALVILGIYAFWISIPQAGIIFIVGAVLFSPIGIPLVTMIISMFPEMLYHSLKKLIYE